MKTLRLGLATLALAAGPLHAAGRVEVQLDVGNAAMIPVAGSTYTSLVAPSYAGSLRVAVPIRIVDRFRVGPYFQLEGVALQSANGDAELGGRYGRLRVLAGAHLAVRVQERVDVWARIGVGLDYVAASVDDFRGSTTASSSAVGFDPGIGTTVRVWRRLTVGAALSFPIAVSQSFSTSGFSTSTSFTTTDVEVSVLVGARL